MQRAEQSASMRYSHVIKLRADVWAQGVLPSAEDFPALFDGDKAYVFGDLRKNGDGVTPQYLPIITSPVLFCHNLPLRYPNDFFMILGRKHATAAVALLRQGGMLLPPRRLLKRSCRGQGKQSMTATNAVWPECYLIFALESAYGARNVVPFPPNIGDAWSWIKPGEDDVRRLKLHQQQQQQQQQP